MSRIIELADAYAQSRANNPAPHTAAKARAALVAEVEKLEKDAARYRWLREASDETPSKTPVATLQNGAGWQVRYEYYGDRFKPFVVYQKETLDAAIDAALGETK